jgi:N-ethylmaleimide reductase
VSSLFTPIKLGKIDLANRIVMAPMTRSRASQDGVVGDLTVTYYAQRASAGLIVTEGVFPTASGKSGVGLPGIETDAQEAGWKAVAQGVHDAGGRIVLQLMHAGRISHPDLQPNGQLPVAPSAIRPKGQAWTEEGQKGFVTPRELTLPEIRDIVEGHRMATRRGMNAGFDGVELHGSGGYLSEQFLSSGANHRTDEYGGSIPNRARFMLEVLGVMIAEAGPGRVGLRLSPENGFPNDIYDATPRETFAYLTDQLPAAEMACLNVSYFDRRRTDHHTMFRSRFGGTLTIGSDLTKESAEALLDNGEAAATFFGRAFIANPDLVERLRRKAPLNKPDRATFYHTPGPEGYIDYPTLS